VHENNNVQYRASGDDVANQSGVFDLQGTLVVYDAQTFHPARLSPAPIVGFVLQSQKAGFQQAFVSILTSIPINKKSVRSRGCEHWICCQGLLLPWPWKTFTKVDNDNGF
jgi:hypothetical protein